MREISTHVDSTHVDIQAGASLVSLADGRVRFHQSERFRGMAVPFLWAGLRRHLTSDFAAMNLAIKARAERAEAEFAAMRGRRAS